MLAIERVPHLGERRRAAWVELDRGMLERGKGPRAAPMAVFDIGENGLRLFQSAVGNEPPRRLWNPCSQEQDKEPKKGADEEGGAPAEVWGQDCRVEQDHGACRADSG